MSDDADEGQGGPPHFSIRQLAEAAKLLHAGKRDQVEILRKQIAEGKSRRTELDVEKIGTQIPPLFRLARALFVMSERREDLPRWLVALLEDGDE